MVCDDKKETGEPAQKKGSDESEVLKWRKLQPGQDIYNGQIIRRKLENPRNPPEDFGGYIYGKATGGFGMTGMTHGNAIFIENEGWTFEETRDETTQDTARWERYQDIELLDNGGSA